MKPLRILVACEFSGTVRDAFAAKGHDAWSCDLLPTERTGNHIQGDVLEILNDGWDLMIAHPPCTRLCNTAVRWLHERNLWEELQAACDFFNRLLDAPIAKIVVENPIQHKYARSIIGREYNQIIQPWMFGHGETKATCLWLKNLPLLQPTHRKNDLFCEQEPTERIQRIFNLPPSKDRSMARSKTLPGVAFAMAKQWSGA